MKLLLFLLQSIFFETKFFFAVTQNTIIGRTRGKVGGVVFSKWRGLNTLRGKPQSVRNPKSAGQEFQRGKLTLLVALYRNIALIVKTGFFEDAVKKSAYNAWLQENILNAITGTSKKDVAIDYDKLVVSKGSVGVTPIASVGTTAGSNVVTVNWDKALAPVGSSVNDIPLVMAYNQTKGEYSVLIGTSVVRSAGTITISLKSNVASGDVVYVYLAFKSATSSKTSDSVISKNTVTIVKNGK